MGYRIVNLVTPSPVTALMTPSALNEDGEAGGVWQRAGSDTEFDGVLWAVDGSEQLRVTDFAYTNFMGRNTHGEAIANVQKALGGPWTIYFVKDGVGRLLSEAFAGHEVYATGMNEHGVVTGFTAVGGKQRAFSRDVRAGGATLLLDLLPGYDESFGADIANNGDIVGQCSSASGRRGCVWSGGSVRDLGDYDFAGVNDYGLIAGTRGALGARRGGILDYSTSAPTFSELPLPPGFEESSAQDVNNKGKAVGYVWAHDSASFTDFTGVIWDGSPRLLSSLTKSDTGAYLLGFRVNERGDITSVRNGRPVVLYLDYAVDIKSQLYGELIKIILVRSGTDAPHWAISGIRVNLPNGSVINLPPIPVPNGGPPGPAAHLSPAQEQALLSLTLQKLVQFSANAATGEVLQHAARELLRLAAHFQ